MHMRPVAQVSAHGAAGDVSGLFQEVLGVADPVFVVPRLPDLTRKELSELKGKALFQELHSPLDGFRGGDHDQKMVGHDNERVQRELAMVTEAGECSDNKFCVVILFKDWASFMGDGKNSIVVRFQNHERDLGKAVEADCPFGIDSEGALRKCPGKALTLLWRRLHPAKDSNGNANASYTFTKH